MWYIKYVVIGSEEVVEGELADPTQNYTVVDVKEENREELLAKLFLLGCVRNGNGFVVNNPHVGYTEDVDNSINKAVWSGNGDNLFGDLYMDLTLMRRLTKGKTKNGNT